LPLSNSQPLKDIVVGAGEQAAGLPRELVLYCARHDFGSFVLAKTSNLKAVMNAMGHGDVRSAMVYRHPESWPSRQ
jgi:site-specific recombinase XerC